MSQEVTLDQAQRSPSKPVWVLLAMLAAAVLLYSLMQTEAPAPGEVHTAVGSRLRAFATVPLTGDAQPLSTGELKDSVTLINFWGTWCGPCRRELPHLIKLMEHYSDRPDFRAILISCGSGEDEDVESLRAETNQFLKAAGLRLPTYADPKAVMRRALLAYFPDGFGYPTTLILDSQGIIRGVWEGYSPSSSDEMRELIDQLLKAGTPSDGKPTAQNLQHTVRIARFAHG